MKRLRCAFAPFGERRLIAVNAREKLRFGFVGRNIIGKREHFIRNFARRRGIQNHLCAAFARQTHRARYRVRIDLQLEHRNLRALKIRAHRIHLFGGNARVCIRRDDDCILPSAATSTQSVPVA